MPNAPRLSVVCPMYNSGEYLAATIESILAQSMTDLELVLSDDGSTDDTLEIADDFAAKDPRVRVVRNAHKGIVATRNSGLAATDRRSEFITLFDSDDLWEKHAAATLMAALQRNPQAPAAHGVCRCVDMNGVQFPNDDREELTRNRFAIAGDKVVAVPRSAPTSFGALLIENYITTPGNSMIRRTAFDAVGNFAAGIEPCDDWDMNLRIARLGDFVFVDEVLLSWRRHSMSISNVSTRWRNAVMATRYRSIYSRENTPEQRMAARAAVRRDMKYLLKDAVAKALQGEFSSAPKKLARVGLFAAVYVGLHGSNPS
jgi:glycosyltransferase involved in cell wall biosynthesis